MNENSLDIKNIDLSLNGMMLELTKQYIQLDFFFCIFYFLYVLHLGLEFQDEIFWSFLLYSEVPGMKKSRLN